MGNFVRHGVNPLRYTQLRTVWGSEYEVKKGSPTPTGAKDLPLHRELGAEMSLKTRFVEGSPSPTGAKVLPLHQEWGAEKSIKTSPEKQDCLSTEQSEVLGCGMTEEANKVFQAMIDAGAIEEVSK